MDKDMCRPNTRRVDGQSRGCGSCYVFSLTQNEMHVKDPDWLKRSPVFSNLEVAG